MFTDRTIQIFSEKYFSDYTRALYDRMLNEINRTSEEYILNINEDEYVISINSEFCLEPIEFDFNNYVIPKPSKIIASTDRGSVEGYNFVLTIPFTGSPIILSLAPGQRTLISYPITVDEENSLIKASFDIFKQSTEEFESQKNNIFAAIKANLNNVNKEVEGWNNSLPQLIKNAIINLKTKITKEHKFFESLNLKVDKSTVEVFKKNPIRKKAIPRPPVKKETSRYKREPTFDDAVYKDVCDIIYDVCKSMERKPATYKGKSEESLRDSILMFLETRYEGTTATGETFNKEGKTDILLKYEDGTNLFIAECKIWKGEKVLYDTINQLFKYLTWRDSKSAIIFFVQNKDFTNVINTLKDKIQGHENYVKNISNDKETSFTYIFSFPDDKEKKIFLEIMLFYFP